MEKSGSKSLHLQGGVQEDHHLAISGCRNGHGPDLNGEPYALKGARTVRGGEALMRFLLHVRLAPRNRGSVCLECNEKGGNVISLLPAVRKHEPKRR